MSEEALKQVFGDDIAEDLPDENSHELPSDLVLDEDQPKKNHMSKEAWVAAGKNPDDWVSEEVFKERGLRFEETKKLRKELSRVQQDADTRIANLNKLHRLQLDQERNKLLVERDSAIDIADKAEVRRLDQALQANSDMRQQVAEQPQKPAEVVEWENDNQWIFNAEDPRTAPAIAAFAEAQKAGKSLSGCILAADRAASQAKPATPTTKRTAMPAADVPKTRQSTGGKLQLSMKDITGEERSFRSFYSSDAEFLKAVSDSRE